MHSVSETFTLPGAARDVQVCALHKGPDAGLFQVFQGARLRPKTILQSGILLVYKSKLKFHKLDNLLAEMIEGPVDALLRLPSDHPWQAEPYYHALQRKFGTATDLSNRVTRTGDARSHRGAALNELIQGYRYASGGDEGRFKSLLIVDDTFTTGNSIAAVLELLKRAGLLEDCSISLACVLWINKHRTVADSSPIETSTPSNVEKPDG